MLPAEGGLLRLGISDSRPWRDGSQPLQRFAEEEPHRHDVSRRQRCAASRGAEYGAANPIRMCHEGDQVVRPRLAFPAEPRLHGPLASTRPPHQPLRRSALPSDLPTQCLCQQLSPRRSLVLPSGRMVQLSARFGQSSALFLFHVAEVPALRSAQGATSPRLRWFLAPRLEG